MEPNKPRVVYIDDEKLATDIQNKLAAADCHVDKGVILTIMKLQQNNYENLGIIKLVYRK